MATILMLCHDQHLDRRVVAQAMSLIEIGHTVRLLALSFSGDTVEESLPGGLMLVRIGLRHIVPDNVTYCSYMKRQHRLNDMLNWLANRYPPKTGFFQKWFSFGSRCNWRLYKLTLLVRYRNRRLDDPLPFRQAFLSHAWKFRSDVVQVHDLPALSAGAELANEWKVPLVYDAHELYPEQKSFSRVQRKICTQAEARLIQQAKLVFTVNESIGQEMARRYRITPPKIVTNAVDPLPGFDPCCRHNLLREKLGLAETRRILLFQGGFSRHRNLERLIAAFGHVQTDDVDLVLLGFGDFGESLKRLAARLHLLDARIYFLPAVPQVELLAHSASADLGIIPYPHVDLNSYFCTPNKLFEFIQACLPILANDSPELRRFVDRQGFGMVAPMHSARQIARAIDRAFNSPDCELWRRKLISKRNEFTWKVQSLVYQKALCDLVNNRILQSEPVETCV